MSSRDGLYISDKSHSWLANSSPLAVTIDVVYTIDVVATGEVSWSFAFKEI